jgi:hypothetical protein
LIAHPYLIARNSEGSPRVGSDGRVSGANTTGLTGSHTHGDGHNHGTGLTGNHTTGEHNHNHSTDNSATITVPSTFMLCATQMYRLKFVHDY